MNQKALIGIVIAIILIGGAAWLLTSLGMGSGTATSTSSSVTTDVPADTTTATPSASAPSVTTGTLVVSSNSSAVMTGKVTPNGSQSTYWYEYGKTSSLGSRTGSQGLGSGFISISAPAFITGLSANTNYSYQLIAQNDLGTVRGDILSFSTSNNPAPKGSVPSVQTGSATSILRSGATLDGHVTPNGADTSFWFEYGLTGAFGRTTIFGLAGAGATSVGESSVVTGLLPGTKYYFRINAQNQFGTAIGGTNSFVTSVAAPGTKK